MQKRNFHRLSFSLSLFLSVCLFISFQTEPNLSPFYSSMANPRRHLSFFHPVSLISARPEHEDLFLPSHLSHLYSHQERQGPRITVQSTRTTVQSTRTTVLLLNYLRERKQGKSSLKSKYLRTLE